MSACAGPTGPSPTPIAFDRAPAPMDEVDCEGLLTEAEVEGILGTDVRPLGRQSSSCYWIGSDAFLQLVFNTGEHVPAWREQLLETHTARLDTPVAELWVEPESGSVAAFGPERGLIVHGAGSRADAARLLLLALARL